MKTFYLSYVIDELSEKVLGETIDELEKFHDWRKVSVRYKKDENTGEYYLYGVFPYKHDSMWGGYKVDRYKKMISGEVYFRKFRGKEGERYENKYIRG